MLLSRRRWGNTLAIMQRSRRWRKSHANEDRKDDELRLGETGKWIKAPDWNTAAILFQQQSSETEIGIKNMFIMNNQQPPQTSSIHVGGRGSVSSKVRSWNGCWSPRDPHEKEPPAISPCRSELTELAILQASRSWSCSQQSQRQNSHCMMDHN